MWGGYKSVEFDIDMDGFARLKVVGIGGGGNNSKSNDSIRYAWCGIHFCYTDKQALFLSRRYQNQIGDKLTKDLEQAPIRKSAKRQTSRDEIAMAIKDDIVL